MEVILLQDVESLGGKGSLVSVARGYARNYLIPRRLAEVATPGRVVEFQRREEERKSREARLAAQAEEHTETLNKTVLTITAKAGEGDRLFGPQLSRVAQALQQAGLLEAVIGVGEPGQYGEFARLRQCLHQIPQLPRLDLRNRDQLPATGAAGVLAGDLQGRLPGVIHREGDDGVREVAKQRQDIRQARRPGRNWHFQT